MGEPRNGKPAPPANGFVTARDPNIVARPPTRRHKDVMTIRRVAFYLGWLLLLAAFVAGAAEGLVRSDPGRGPALVSTHDLWYWLWPGNRVVTQIKVERLSPALWSNVIRPLLELPAWALAGVPGALLAWFCRPIRRLTADEEQDMRDRADSMFLYDALAEQAMEEGYGEGDDMAPDHDEHLFMDDAGVTAAESETDFDIDMPHLPPPPDGGR